MNIIFSLILILANFPAPFQESEGTRIYQIQGKSHQSPFLGKRVSNVTGLVIALKKSGRKSGFWMQDPEGDHDPATSDGIFVASRLQDAIEVGALVSVDGSIAETGFSGALTRTQIQATQVRTISRENPLPQPIHLGIGGRLPPTDNIDDDGMTQFEPETDGIDFYESLEGMRVEIKAAVVVGPTSRFGEIPVLPNDGIQATVRGRRGGILTRENDFNPEIIILDDLLITHPPKVKVGDKFSAPIAGIIDYSFGNFKLLNIKPLPDIIPGDLHAEVTELVAEKDFVTVASFNVENLHFKNNQKKYDAIAKTIVTNLASPDVIALQEVQDNSGPADDGVVAADSTLYRLIDSIARLNGIRYEFCQLNPVNRADGGQPGGNIRIGFLYNPKRIVFEPASDNPQKIGVEDSAFTACRKSLVAEFIFKGYKVTLINNHLKSKRGDDGLFGANQPPEFRTEPQRTEQARIINRFVKSMLEQDPKANIIVLGDMNELEFREPMRILAGGELTDLLFAIPQEDRYTYIFNGNSQVLDHILISPNLSKTAKPEIDIVHVNAEYPARDRSSDHDPVMARFRLAK